jgi:hypothetical protein
MIKIRFTGNRRQGRPYFEHVATQCLTKKNEPKDCIASKFFLVPNFWGVLGQLDNASHKKKPVNQTIYRL